MDRPINRFRTPRPISGTTQRCSQLKTTPRKPQNLSPSPNVQTQTGTAATITPEGHPKAISYRELPISKNKAQKVNSLISRFESLDTKSLNFTVRQAPASTFTPFKSQQTDTPEMDRMKVTRENLLRSFDRPGWGAETLRGLSGTEDGEPYRGFDEMDSGIGRGCYGSKIYEITSAPASSTRLTGVQEASRSYKDLKTKQGRVGAWSKVKERVKFFDGSMDKHPPTQNSKMLNGTVADGAVASHATTQQASLPSSTVRRPQTESPQRQAENARTPTRLGRFGRDKQPSSSSARFDGLQNIHRASPTPLSRNTDSVYRRGPHQRAQCAFPTPAPAGALVAARHQNDAFETNQTKLNERVGGVHAARPSEREKDAEADLCVMDTGDTILISNPFLTSRTVFEKDLIDGRMVDGRQGYLDEKESELRTGEPHSIDGVQRPRRKSKVQERIMLFNQEGPRVRYYPPPPALSSQYHSPIARHEPSRTRAQTLATTRPPSQNKRLRSQTPLGHTHPTSPNRHSNFTSAELPAKQKPQRPTKTPPPPPFQPPRLHTPAPRKQSQINDRIRHFESIFSGKPGQSTSRAMAIKGSMSEPPPQRVKRVETWPMPSPARSKLTLPIPDWKDEYIRESNSNRPPPRMAYHTNIKCDKDRQRDRSREKAMQKIHARQERLHRRSRSRSRSGVSSAVGVSSASQHRHLKLRQQQEQQTIREDIPALLETPDLAAQEAHARAKVQLILDSASHELSRHSRRRGPERRGPEEGDAATAKVNFNVAGDVDVYGHGVDHGHADPVSEIWIDGSDDGGEMVGVEDRDVRVVNSVVAQCELAHPKPLRLAETIRMMKLCGRGFGERGSRGLSLGIRL